MKDLTSLRTEFKKIRIKRKLNGNDIATAAHSGRTVIDFEQGRSEPSIGKFLRWLEVMGCEILIINKK